MLRHKILVTGATGWVGRSFLHELQSIIPSSKFNSTVFAFASKSASLASTNYAQKDSIYIPIYPLSSILDYANNQDVLLFHSAFLTKDRIPSYGLDAFIETNQRITETVTNCVRASASSRVVCISSGAASNAEKDQESSIVTTRDPYGHLKLSEEISLSTVADTQVFRIYALTGQFIRDPQIFAIGDFLLKALNRKPVRINSTFPVIRSYVSAADVAKCALCWLMSTDKPRLPIGASSHIATLTSLAALVSKLYGLPPTQTNPFTDGPDSYCCSPIPFDQISSRYGIRPLTLEEQVLDTARGIESAHL